MNIRRDMSFEDIMLRTAVINPRIQRPIRVQVLTREEVRRLAVQELARKDLTFVGEHRGAGR